MTLLHLLAQLPFTVLGPKCHSTDCLAVAVATVHWPAGPLRCCTGCAARWLLVAHHGFGMHLVVVPLPAWELPGDDPAVLRFRAMELE